MTSGFDEDVLARTELIATAPPDDTPPSRRWVQIPRDPRRLWNRTEVVKSGRVAALIGTARGASFNVL